MPKADILSSEDPVRAGLDYIRNTYGPQAAPPVVKAFEFSLESQALRVTGYSADEVSALLRVYRENMQEIASFAQGQTSVVLPEESHGAYR